MTRTLLLSSLRKGSVTLFACEIVCRSCLQLATCYLLEKHWKHYDTTMGWDSSWNIQVERTTYSTEKMDFFSVILGCCESRKNYRNLGMLNGYTLTEIVISL